MLKYLLLLLLGTSLLLGQMDFSEGGMNFGDSSSSFSKKKKKKKKIYRKKKKKKKKKKKNSSKVTFDKGDSGMNFGEDTTKKKEEKKTKKTAKDSSGMDFGNSGGMNFGNSTKKKKNSGGMDFGNSGSSKKSGGMDFGDSGSSKKSDGMDFGGDSGGGMDFGKDSGGGMDFGKDSGGGMDFGKDSGGGMDFGKEAAADDDLLMDLEADQTKIDEKKKKALANKFKDSVKTKKVVKEEKIKIVRKPQNYIEKGTFFRFTAGPVFLLDPKISGEAGDEKDVVGTQLEMALGFDFSKQFSSELFVTFVSNGMQRRAEDDGILYNSDVNGKVIGLGFNYSFLSNNRFFMTGSIHGGVLLLDNTLDDSGLKFAGGAKIGMEYYLLLRHFSVLITGRGDYFTGLDTVGLSLSASIKYSF